MNYTTSKLTATKKEKLSFACIFCHVTISAVLGATHNVKSHLETHKEIVDLQSWLDAYDKQSSLAHNKSNIDAETMKIVRYFISSNTAASNFDCPIFRDLFSGYKIKVPCSKTFSKVILDDVFTKVKVVLDRILNESASVCLISDIWTNKQMLDFMGIAANTIKADFTRQTIVIGMCPMPGCHNAENIKKAIETIVNEYSFNKSILSGMI